MESQAQLDSEAPSSSSSSSSRSTSPEANEGPKPDWADNLKTGSANSGTLQRPAGRDANTVARPILGIYSAKPVNQVGSIPAQLNTHVLKRRPTLCIL